MIRALNPQFVELASSEMFWWDCLWCSGVVAEESKGNVSELDLWVDVPMIDLNEELEVYYSGRSVYFQKN